MTPPPRTTSKRRRKTRRPASGSSLSATSVDAIDRFVRVLARCGNSPQDILREVQAACSRVPEGWVAQGRVARQEIGDASHVLTVWFTDLTYLDPFGKPRSLTFDGSRESVTGLVRSVDPRLRPREVLEYLLRTGAVRRQGQRYAPRARTLLLRGAQGPDYFRTLRVLANMLRTLEHNVLPKRAVRGWFEYFAENPRFPARYRHGLDKLVGRLGTEMLKRLDAYMRRREVTRKPGERTVRVGVGLHLWEDAHRGSGGGARSTGRARKAKSVAKPAGRRR